MKTNNATTMKYDYGNRDSEYVFCYKSRPFAVLVSDSLPTPNSSFVDHLLINELGLKINDIQCKKISFGGKKLRLLGRVNCTVQCVKQYMISWGIEVRMNSFQARMNSFQTRRNSFYAEGRLE